MQIVRLQKRRFGHGASQSIHRLCRLRRSYRVHPHRTDVATETGLEVRAGGCIERLPRRAEHLVHNAGRFTTGAVRRLGTLHCIDLWSCSPRSCEQFAHCPPQAHLRRSCISPGAMDCLGAGMRRNWSATRSASCSSGSYNCPTLSLGWIRAGAFRVGLPGQAQIPGSCRSPMPAFALPENRPSALGQPTVSRARKTCSR